MIIDKRKLRILIKEAVLKEFQRQTITHKDISKCIDKGELPIEYLPMFEPGTEATKSAKEMAAFMFDYLGMPGTLCGFVDAALPDYHEDKDKKDKGGRKSQDGSIALVEPLDREFTNSKTVYFLKEYPVADAKLAAIKDAHSDFITKIETVSTKSSSTNWDDTINEICNLLDTDNLKSDLIRLAKKASNAGVSDQEINQAIVSGTISVMKKHAAKQIQREMMQSGPGMSADVKYAFGSYLSYVSS